MEVISLRNTVRPFNEWDGKWYSAVQNYEDRWVAEFKIPFRTIRYHEGDTEWGINFSRLDLKTNEKSPYAAIPSRVTC